jgi:hypothetical protein
MAVANLHIPVNAGSYAAAIEGLTRVNERILRAKGARIPPLYSAGVVYRREDRDTWKPIVKVIRERGGDCEDLSAWRVAELRVSGEDPNARVHVYQSGPRRYHAVVARGDGRIEDPSKRLGMLKQNRIERAQKMREFVRNNVRAKPIDGKPGAWVGVGEDPMPDTRHITFDLYRSGKGWAGIVRIPLAHADGMRPAAIFAKTTRTPPDAGNNAAKRATATKAVRLAAKIAANPAVQAVLPPQTAMAVKLMQGPLGTLATKQAGKVLAKLF